jgi:hypothetical protein
VDHHGAIGGISVWLSLGLNQTETQDAGRQSDDSTLLASGIYPPNVIPCASGRSSPQLIVVVWRRI